MASKKLSLATAIGVGITSSLAAITPANAVTGCGESGEGVTVTDTPDYCQATFVSGTRQFTLPNGVSDLYGIVVAGGGGAYIFNADRSNETTTGYAGSGGEAKTFYWGNLAPNANIVVQVGIAGASDVIFRDAAIVDTVLSTRTNGGNSSVTFGNFVISSDGGSSPAYGPNCTTSPWPQSNPALQVTLGYITCDNRGSAGLNPALAPAPTIFSNSPTNLGMGGGRYSSAPTPTQLQAGEGAGIVIDETNGIATEVSAKPGLVILRFKKVSTPASSSTSYSSPTYGITFDGNGADNPSDTAPLAEFLKSGYRFVGWNTKADGLGSPFVLGKSIPVSGDMKLFAQWEKNPATEKGKKRISTFIGDSAQLNSSLKSQISNWVRSVPADAQILCKGSTSGTRVTAFDTRLARTRAQNACDYAVKLRSDVVFKIGVNPSSSTKVSARNVWMSYIS